MANMRIRHNSRAHVGPSTAAQARQQDLTIGLHTVTEINQSIRYADTKAGALAAVQALAVSVLAAKRDTTAGHLLVTILFLVCLAAVLISAALLAAGQLPRLSGRAATAQRSRTAFPSLASLPEAEVLRTPSLTAQHEQVWRQAAELAAIAMAKYRWLHRAMAGTLGTLTAVLLWLGITAWLAQR